MPKEPYKIIATIYKLLGEYDGQQLRHASRQKGLPRSIRVALSSLATEADRSQAQVGLFGRDADSESAAKSTTRKRRPSNGLSQGPSLSPNLPDSIYKQNLSDFLASQSRFQGKRELVEFAKKIGYDADVGPKDSRKRVEAKIVSHALDSIDFRKQIYELVPNNWAKQTSGWLDLILHRE